MARPVFGLWQVHAGAVERSPKLIISGAATNGTMIVMACGGAHATSGDHQVRMHQVHMHQVHMHQVHMHQVHMHQVHMRHQATIKCRQGDWVEVAR